ncbi:MAG: CAP domain-containing protein [Verrucomicrobiales bacterium]|nr:CAP domain-containing protein [Verrucomicrobiales bacterium]
MRKIPLLIALLSISIFPLVLQGQETPVDPEAAKQQAEAEAALEKARQLFPEFQNAMLTEKTKADKAFAEFLKMPDSMQERLQIWLDQQWVEKRREYELSTGGSTSNSGGSLQIVSTPAMAENRALLARIRAMSNENEMKKELKSKGWPALVSLLGSTRQTGSAPAGVKNPHKTARLLKEATTIGEYRYKIRFNRRQPAKRPHEELGLPDPGKETETSAKDTMATSAKNREILNQNEKLKGQIQAAEYAGILELNQWRIAAGLSPLLIDPKLCAAARDHSKDMAAGGFFSHTSPIQGKKSPWDRARNFGTSASSENIAINGSTEGANKSWFHSPGHHKNMFRENATIVGLGVNGRHYTQMFR